MLNITVMVSGGGTNLQAIIDGIDSKEIENAKIVQIISSNSKAYSLERAKKHNIKAVVIGKENYEEPKARTKAIIEALKEEKTDLIVLAGYMSILEPELIAEFRGRIINIHPSLIPEFCGAGFYGKRVHQAVIDAGKNESGATVHFVDEGVDTGPIIIQEKVRVLKDDTADSLAERVLETEHNILKKGLNIVIDDILKERMVR